MEVKIVAFRGTGFRNSEYKSEPGLVRSGHVGIIFEEDVHTIYGFHPTSQAEEDAGGIEELITLLKSHYRQPGTVQVDSGIFLRAYELAEQGKLDRQTEVLALTYELPDDLYRSAREKILTWHKSQTQFWYNFPKRYGDFDPGEFNCAVFPKQTGIPIPLDDGNVKKYISAMREQGATKWDPTK
ncbi:MAG: hypothetical protein L0154_20675 [Chloroflexi bacterium]|nr:hypothetical protein [Chloroflexota bacterium]